MYRPSGVAVDASGNVYISCSDGGGGYILKVANGSLSIIAGNGTLPSGTMTNGAPAVSQSIGAPRLLAVDAAGNVYVAAQYNGGILEINTANGTVSMIAGNGQAGFSGDGGPAINAAMTPFGVALDASGNLYIADSGNSRIREVVNGTINTIAGGGSANPCTAGAIPATTAQLHNPIGIAVHGSNVYFGDAFCVHELVGGSTSGPPSINAAGGIISASAFGAFSAAAPGSWIEIYGANLATTTRSWANSDFTGPNNVVAPTSLSGTSVTIGGLPAVIYYVSPGQLNVQVPQGVGTGLQPVVVTTPSGATAQSTITINQTEAGLLAPSSFSVNGTQYVVALVANTSTYVLPAGAVSGVASQLAQPGQTITFYGVGFGPVTPGAIQGQVVTQQNQLAGLQISIGGSPAQIQYAGLAPGFVGLYQFNVVVPNIPANNAAPVTFTLGGVKSAQTLYTAVQ
jgi:uncharacterized protein (TIGR03437 family)